MIQNLKLQPPGTGPKVLEVEKPDGNLLRLHIRKRTVETSLELEKESQASLREYRQGNITGTEFNLRFLETFCEDFRRASVMDLEHEHLEAIIEAVGKIHKPDAEEKKSGD